MSKFSYYNTAFILNAKCRHNSLDGRNLTVFMNQASKEFWDMLFILYLTQQKSTKIKFSFLIGAAPIIDGELFKKSNAKIPEYYSYEKRSFWRFFINYQVKV